MTATTETIAFEYAKNSPCVAERGAVYGSEAQPLALLKRMLTRYGLDPFLVGFARQDDRIFIKARNSDGREITIGRILFGVDLAALDQAREELISDAWSPRAPEPITIDRNGNEVAA